jgi:hypothetical protein
MEFTKFNASVSDGTCSDPEIIISRSLDLDARYRFFYTNIPAGWEYETVFLDAESRSGFVYNGHYHVCYDYWNVQMWNGMRTVRIILHEFMRGVPL